MRKFFVGIHQISDAWHFEQCCISVNRLRPRIGKPFAVGEWIMDSGAFSELSRRQDVAADGQLIPNDYRHDVAEYARQIVKWRGCGRLLAAVAQDYMCEPFILEKTRMTVLEHQQKTIARYDELLCCETGVYILPVLQGYAPADYVRHLRMYGTRLALKAWVAVGSVCKRNGTPEGVVAVLRAIKDERPDLQLHGFGLKKTALADPQVRELLETSDSMAWSLHERMHGRDGNHWSGAMRYWESVQGLMTTG